MNARRLTVSVTFILMLALAALPLLAAGEPPIRSEVKANGLVLQTGLHYSSATLTLVMPNGEWVVMPYTGGQALVLPVNPGQGIWQDGFYKWELVLNQTIPAGKREALENLRNQGNPAAMEQAMRQAGIQPRKDRTLSGVFTIAQGKMALPIEEEIAEPDEASSAQVTSSTSRTVGSLPGETLNANAAGDVTPQDQVILDDLIVDGSICAGFDCVSGEAFGFDTIRMKENNLRLKAQDTSTTSSFPGGDWQLTFNDSANGGLNKFSVDDIDGGRTPFTIEQNAPSNSLYVDDAGRVGLGTNNPVVELHVVDGDTPTMRLEQNGSSGFGLQTWDVAGNESNFFIRDATNGSQLAFKIIPGADANSVYINSNNNVGIGDSSPSAHLTVRRGGETAIGMENSTTGQNWYMLNDSASAFSWSTSTSSADNQMSLDASGNLSTEGMMTQGSSRAIKQNLLPVNGQAVIAKILDLPVLQWQYSKDETPVNHIGPMAEDFHQAFGLGANPQHLAPGDTAGVALVAIQELARDLQEKSDQLTALEKENQDLMERLAALEALVEKMDQANSN